MSKIDDLRARQRLDEIKKQSQPAKAELNKKNSIAEMQTRFKEIKDDLQLLDNARKKGPLNQTQLKAAQQLNDRLKQELVKEDLVKNNNQLKTQLQKSNNNNALFRMLLIITAYKLEHERHDDLLKHLEKKDHLPNLKHKPHPAKSEEEEEDEEEEKNLDSPGKRLSKFFDLMAEGEELSPKFDIDQIKAGGKIQLTKEQQYKVVNADSYVQDALKSLPKPKPGASSLKEEDELNNPKGQRSPRPLKTKPEPF